MLPSAVEADHLHRETGVCQLKKAGENSVVWVSTQQAGRVLARW